MLWIKEVEMVNSVDDLESSCSVRGLTPFPDFELLDARIASVLNKIIWNSYFKKKVSLEEQKAQKADRFLRGRQNAYLIYDCFRVTGVNESVLDYADLFTVVLRNDDIQEFDTRRDENVLSMEQFLLDDILESLYNFRTRESDQLKTVMEYYEMEIHQKISTPNYQKLKTMVKRSIEQNLRSQNFEARDGRIASGILVKNQREQRRVHKGQGECWEWNANGQSSKGGECSSRHDEDKRAKFAPPPAPSPEPSTPQDVRNPARTKSPRGRRPSGRVPRLPCKEHLKRTCTNPSCESAFSRVPVPQDKKRDANSGKSARLHTSRLIAAKQKVLKE